MMSVVNKTSPEVSLTTAWGSWGCGGFSNTQWFSVKWVASVMSLHITTNYHCNWPMGAPLERTVSASVV